MQGNNGGGGVDYSQVIAALVPLLDKNNQLLDYLRTHGIEAFVLYDKWQREQRIYEESMKKGSKN
jgi:hypothetical protein